MSFLKNTELLPQLCAIHFATVSQVMGYIRQADPRDTMPVLGSGVWQNLYHTLSSANLREQQKTSPHGSVYEYELSLRYPGLHKYDPHSFADLDHHQWILLLHFQNGDMRVIGNTDAGCDFSWAFNLDSPGFTLNWSLQDSEPAKNLKYILQFFIDDDQHLIQQFQDANTYTLNADKHLIMDGPQSPDYKYEEGQLKTDEP